jgi:hypothetical protein
VVTEAVKGQWIRRTPTRPWHLAESVFIDEALTKCGRFMATYNKKSQKLEIFKGPGERPGWVDCCIVCQP